MLRAAEATETNQEGQRTARIEQINASRAKKKGTHPQNRIKGQFSRQKFNAFYNELKELAKETQDEAILHRGPNRPLNHKFLYEILQKPNIENLIFETFKVCCRHNDRLEFKSLEQVIKFFSDNDVDIVSFVNEQEDDDDIQSRYDKDVASGGVSAFLKRMLLYTLRIEQFNCGKCGKLIEERLFGGPEFQSNHIRDDYAQNDEEKIKYKDANINLFLGDLCDALYEICKTSLECAGCHDKHGFLPYAQMPDRNKRTYNFPIRPIVAVQQSVEGRQVLNCIEGLKTNVASRSFADISRTLSEQTLIHSNDAFGFNESTWNNANASTRIQMLSRAYFSAEKRMAGGCMLCGEIHCNLTVRDQRGGDLHHVEESEKNWDPSTGVNKPVAEALQENRKTCLLCKKCHVLVHHRVRSNEAFMDKLLSKYCVDESTGEIFARPASV